MNNDVVIIDLDRPRVLKFNHTALKTLVELTGKSLEEIEGSMDVSNFEFMEKMAYAALLKDAKDNGEVLTMEAAVDLIDNAPSFVYAVEKLIAAFRIAFGAPVQ